MSPNVVKFRWVEPPSNLSQQIEQYGEKVLVAVHAVAAYWGLSVQNQARGAAPWHDRTGNARSGLFFAVDGFGLPPIVGRVRGGARQQMRDTAAISGGPERLVVALGHTVYYGRFLELCNGGKYAVVMSTLENNLPRLERMLRQLLR